MGPDGPFFGVGRATGVLVVAGALGLVAALFGPSWNALVFAALLPVIVVVVAVVVLGLFFLVERRRSTRASAREAAGLCVKCGYDLRQSNGDLCPECGMPIWRRRDPLTGKVLTPADTAPRDD